MWEACRVASIRIGRVPPLQGLAKASAAPTIALDDRDAVDAAFRTATGALRG